MNVLVIGSGGREHALAWKLAQSEKVHTVYVAPGNGGTATENGLENVSLSSFDELISFAKKEQIHLTVVGPEAPLAAGVVDAFGDHDVAVEVRVEVTEVGVRLARVGGGEHRGNPRAVSLRAARGGGGGLGPANRRRSMRPCAGLASRAGEPARIHRAARGHA